jgi:hypothetical protein
MPLATVEKNAENLIGLSAETIRKYSPDELRFHLENKNKRKLSFTSEFPVIGHGNVLRDGIKTSEEINKDIDKILKYSKNEALLSARKLIKKHLPAFKELAN